MLKRPDLAKLAERDLRLVHWRLAFTRTNGWYWWNEFVEPGFEHVYAFREVPGLGWVTVNPRYSHTEIAVTPGFVHNARSAYRVDEGAIVVDVVAEVPKRQIRSRWFFGPVTCVEIIKSLLGIRAFWVFTPWQLYRYVRACRGPIRQTQETRTERGRASRRAPPAPGV